MEDTGLLKNRNLKTMYIHSVSALNTRTCTARKHCEDPSVTYAQEEEWVFSLFDIVGASIMFLPRRGIQFKPGNDTDPRSCR